MKNLVFGSTGLVGKAFYRLNYKKNFTIYSSSKDNKNNIKEAEKNMNSIHTV
jgi:hypothetical protein